MLHLRHDQLVLAGIGGLMGLTVVFACGVERGKQLTRGERTLMAQQALQPSQTQAPRAAERPSASQIPSVTPATETGSKTPLAPTLPLKKREPTKLAAGTPPSPTSARSAERRVSVPTASRARYAVQIVSYRRAQLAQKELARLQAVGERAFLILKDGYAVLYVGPFPSKTNAHEKVAKLKGRYDGCFVKAL